MGTAQSSGCGKLGSRVQKGLCLILPAPVRGEWQASRAVMCVKSQLEPVNFFMKNGIYSLSHMDLKRIDPYIQ